MSRSIQLLYIEREIADAPRARQVADRFPAAARVPIDRFGEVFNRRAQSFRLQKKRPGLILARKHDRFVLPAPGEYAVGGRRNFYFSHMLNCVYDCRYCFLQGMYRSAHYVLFVNYEDFQRGIERRLAETPGEDVWFFSGYDCDSLALDRVTGFVDAFVPFFARHDRAWLELRTKSTQVAALLEHRAFPRCVTAFSFTPAAHARLEVGVPSIERRLAAMRRLAARGWPLGLRFDPLLASPDWRRRYRDLFATVFAALDGVEPHSVSFGPFRLPRDFHRRMERLYPDEPLFAAGLDEGPIVSYGEAREREMLDFCRRELERFVPPARLYPCVPPRAAPPSP